MGFFSFLKPILDIAAPIALTAAGIDPAVITGGVATGGVSPVVALAAQQPTAAEIAGMVAAGGSNGSLRRRTIVQTFNPMTGAVVKSETFAGAPAVMNSDVAASNRLNRQLKALNKKRPTKLVKETTAGRLKQDLIESALRQAVQRCLPAPSC